MNTYAKEASRSAVLLSWVVGAVLITGCGPSSDQDARDSLQTTESTGTAPTPAIESVKSIATLVPTEQDLPPCTEDNAGSLYYIKSTSEFRLCESDSYITLDVKGKDGVDGKGEKGDNGKDGVDGKGEKGEKGDNGKDGASAPSGAWLIDADGVAVGAAIKFGTHLTIMTPNGGIFNVFTHLGTIWGTPYRDDWGFKFDESRGSTCAFTTNDCTGTCYVTSGVIDSDFSTTQNRWPITNAVYEKAPGEFVRVTGNEVAEDVTLISALGHDINVTTIEEYAALSCLPIASVDQGTYNSNLITQYKGPAYPIRESYAFPDGVQYPFKAPLFIGPAQ